MGLLPTWWFKLEILELSFNAFFLSFDEFQFSRGPARWMYLYLSFPTLPDMPLFNTLRLLQDSSVTPPLQSSATPYLPLSPQSAYQVLSLLCFETLIILQIISNLEQVGSKISTTPLIPAIAGVTNNMNKQLTKSTNKYKKWCFH